MDSTPPSLRSNPRSALRLARSNNTLIKSNRESPIPSLDLVLSSPKLNDTPYPSPVSLNSPSSPVTLREILLLSPFPLRKSRTRLINRFDMEAAEARRCKTKGGQNGLLSSASPRNYRRSRRRSEVMVETKEDNMEPTAVLVDEKNQKPKKQKKTGRAKKEKLSFSSVPLLPSPCPSSDQSKSRSFVYLLI